MKALSELSNMTTSLVITTYHRDEAMARLTDDCLKSLKYGRPDEVIVVDDASPYHVEYVGVDRYVWRERNGGFPECANSGFEVAKGDIIILSNNDLCYTRGWLEAILKPLEQGFDISSVRMSDGDGYKTEEVITEDDWFGSLWAMRREVYDTIGGFDERFKGGTFEDKDYWVRARDAGFRIGKNHAVVVNHVGRATMDKLYPEQQDFKANAKRFKEKYGYIL